MHYYQHDINKFLAKTARLSDKHKLIYFKLMWHYLYNESSLDGSDKDRLKDIAGCSEKDLDSVLRSMFRQNGDSWYEEELENMLDKYKRHQEASARGGKNSHKNRPKAGGIFGGPKDYSMQEPEPAEYCKAPLRVLKGTQG